MSAAMCVNASSAARYFVQLSTRSHQFPILDVLLPPQLQTRSFGNFAQGLPRTCIGANPFSIPHVKARESSAPRTFSSTASRRKTQPIYNPQNDDDGNEMGIDITPRAANRLSQIMAKDRNPHLALRIQVESGGCHGFQYLMSLLTLPSSLPITKATASIPIDPSYSYDDSIPHTAAAESEIIPSTTSDVRPPEPRVSEDDTIFAFVGDDVTLDQDCGRTLATGPKIILDRPSLDLLKGSKVDYTMELIGSQFKIVDNPLATSSCGCGTSFDIKA